MASTSTSPNNATVKFRGNTEREMPPFPKPVSKTQNAAMHAAAAGKSTIGIPKKVGAEFAKGAAGKTLKGLPEHKPSRRARKHARKMAKRGMISEKAMKDHMGGDY